MSKPFLLFRAPVETISGYGAHSRDILKSLYNTKLFDIKIDSCLWGNTPMTALDTENDLFHLWIKNNMITHLDRQPDYYVQVTVPNEFQTLGKYNIGITAGVETTMIPKDWITGCNKMNLIIVPSAFSKSVMLTTQYNDMLLTKICTKIDVIFEGVDTGLYKKLNFNELKDTKIKNYLDGIDADFCFIFVGHWLKGELGQDRKDVGMLIRKFAEGFNGVDNKPALVLKTSSANFSVKERERLKRSIKNILYGIEKPPSVYLVFGTLADDEMNDMYNHPKIKAMVSFTKGEGFGRPLLEFTMTGKPVLTSNWSGHLDF
jgi:glycosyltransferase involved in cell wall biosynthesis